MDDKLQSDTLEAAERYRISATDAYTSSFTGFCRRIFKEQAEKGGNVREIASALKSHLDNAHGKKWHVVVGSNFGNWSVLHCWLRTPNRFLCSCLSRRFGC